MAPLPGHLEVEAEDGRLHGVRMSMLFTSELIALYILVFFTQIAFIFFFFWAILATIECPLLFVRVQMCVHA